MDEKLININIFWITHMNDPQTVQYLMPSEWPTNWSGVLKFRIFGKFPAIHNLCNFSHFFIHSMIHFITVSIYLWEEERNIQEKNNFPHSRKYHFKRSTSQTMAIMLKSMGLKNMFNMDIGFVIISYSRTQVKKLSNILTNKSKECSQKGLRILDCG